MDLIFKTILVVALMFMMQLLSSLRYWIIMRDFVSELTLKEAHRINIKSIVVSQVFFNFFGQVFARAALTGTSSGSRSVSVLVTSVERACGIGILIILTVLLTLWITGNVQSLLQDNLAVLVYFPVIVVLLLLVFLFRLHSRARRLVVALAARSTLRALGMSLAVTLVMHLLTLFCYLLLVSESYGLLLDSKTLLASLFTMTSASLPVVPGGWGVREASAAFAFSQAGFDVVRGVAVGLGVGITAMAALAIHVLWIGWGHFTAKAEYGEGPEGIPVPQTAASRASLFSLATLSWMAPLVVGILLAFQFRVHSADVAISLNLADPLAIVVGLSVLLFAHKNLLVPANWVFRGFSLSLLLTGGSILIAFVIGYWRYGLIEWALFNRLIGFGVLLCVFLSGAFLVQMNGSWTIRKMLDVLLFVSAIVVLLEFVTRFVAPPDFMKLLEWEYHQYSGFLLNRNAWGFFLLIVSFSWIGVNSDVRFNPFVGLALLGAYATSSRTAQLSLVICFVVLLLLDFRKFRVVLVSFLAALVLYHLTHWLLAQLQMIGALSELFETLSIQKQGIVAGLEGSRPQSSDHERLATFRQGWQLFTENPLWGAGLGRNMQLPVGDRQALMVIHNTFLWVLAEFGLLGFVLFFAPLFLLLVQFFRQKMSLKEPTVQALFFCLVIFGAFSMVHEMAYQRIFWFVLGLLSASAGVFRKTGRGSQTL
ncbi:O-antigen ligase family protein [Kiloniella sp. b19]|uniref:O-antigen ligase family protein n=1 Tax=Kiloniella sp. GXU_MW_B19 TaxID=3141326 RepID=UPI0031DA5747